MLFGDDGEVQLRESQEAELAQRASRELGYAVAERFMAQEEVETQVALA